MRAIFYAALLPLSFLAGCGGQEPVTSNGTTMAPTATGGPAATSGNSAVIPPGSMTPDRASGGGAGTHP